VWGVGDINMMGRGRGGWVGGVGRGEEKREPGSREVEQDNKAHDIQDTDEQQ